MQLQEVTIQIIETINFEQLLSNPNLTHFVESMARIRPYCEPPEAHSAIEAMVDSWNRRRTSHAMRQSVADERKRGERVKRERQALEFLERTLKFEASERQNTPSNDVPEMQQQSDADTEGNKVVEGDPAESSASAASIQQRKDGALPTVDEREYAYSAWMLHEDTLKRLLAASRFVESLPNLGKSLKDEPALLSIARAEAFRLLWEGGQENIYVSRKFLEALKRQQDAEERSKITQDPLCTPAESSKTVSGNIPDSPSKMLVESLQHEFTLSDGDPEYDSVDESE